MKPKFNLAEFLAEPAKPNASRRRTKMSPAPARTATDDPSSDELAASGTPKTATT